MSPAPWSLAAASRRFARGWNKFFHRPCDARVCAAVRIVFALIVLVHFAVLYPDLTMWFTAQGVLPAESAREIASPFSWSLIWFVSDTRAAVETCFWIAVLHTVLLAIGLLPRLNAAALFVWIVSFQVRNELLNDGEDRLMRLIAFLLIWMPIGQCWSVNAWLQRKWHERFGGRLVPIGALPPIGDAAFDAPGWALRLLQIEMVAMLFSAGLLKLAGSEWLDGTALYYVSRLDDFFGRFPTPAWTFNSPWLVALITWSVLLSELVVPWLIWFRETRRLCLAMVVAFHLANEWTMHLFLFHWIMLCGWIAFLTADDVRAIGRLLGLGRRGGDVAAVPPAAAGVAAAEEVHA